LSLWQFYPVYLCVCAIYALKTGSYFQLNGTWFVLDNSKSEVQFS